MKGFNDSLYNIFPEYSHSSLETKAYYLGRIDAIIGDEIEEVDLETDEEILAKIKDKNT
jgi:hypothetical protein